MEVCNNCGFSSDYCICLETEEAPLTKIFTKIVNGKDLTKPEIECLLKAKNEQKKIGEKRN